MGEALPPQTGDMWHDLDRRGGPTFVVVDVCDAENGRCNYVAPVVNHHAHVTAEDGSRARTVRLSAFRPHDSYRTGYALVQREGVDLVVGGEPRG